ncbi:hypothetical protein JJ691_96080 [Kutzneria sp. CA-103260]|nr:hypothetical protein JJ691_96080 [Kutzneria sp. CA-103260]
MVARGPPTSTRGREATSSPRLTDVIPQAYNPRTTRTSVLPDPPADLGDLPP